MVKLLSVTGGSDTVPLSPCLNPALSVISIKVHELLLVLQTGVGGVVCWLSGSEIYLSTAVPLNSPTFPPPTCICIYLCICIYVFLYLITTPQSHQIHPPTCISLHYKGSSIYYVTTFGGLGRPSPHVICNHLDLPPKITKFMRKLRQMGKMQKFGMLTYIYCIFGTSACI